MGAQSPKQWGDQWVACYDAGDVDGLVSSLYDPEATLVYEPGKSVRGHDAIRVVLAGFGTGGALKFNFKAAVENEDLAISYIGWTFDIPNPDGTTNLAGDATVVLTKSSDGTWTALIDDFYSAG
jgi:ketosteroid isomerase-like protein